MNNPIYHLLKVAISITPTSNFYVKLKASDKLHLLVSKTSAIFKSERHRRTDSDMERMKVSKHENVM